MEQKGFDCRLKRSEKVFAWIYLPIFTVGAFYALSFVYALLLSRGTEPKDIELNLALYTPSTLLVLAFMWRFLRSSFDGLLDNLGSTLKQVLICYGIMIALSMVTNTVKSALLGSVPEDNPNEAAIMQQAITDFSKMFAMAVIMAPVVEECLFRGAIFGPIREKSRIAAWVVTVVLFAFYHLWTSFLYAYEPTLWLDLLDYVPGGVALCLCYEKSGNIWGPILLHMATNGISLWAQQALAKMG